MNFIPFEMNKVNPFPALKAPLPQMKNCLIASALKPPLPFAPLSNLSNTDELTLAANLGKTFLTKRTARSRHFCLNCSSHYQIFY